MRTLKTFIISLSLLALASNRVNATGTDGPLVFLNELVNAQSYTVEEILKIEALTASCTAADNPLAVQELKITRYSVATVPKEGNAEAFFGIGNIFSHQFKESLKNLKPGDRIIIRDIYYKTNAGDSGECGKVVIYIK